MFSCDICGIHFTQKCHVNRHKESKHVDVKYSCDQCDYTANRKDNLNRHKKKHRRIDAEADQADQTEQADQADPDLSPEKEKTGGGVVGEQEKTGGDVRGEHDVEHEPQRFKCPHCSMSLRSRGSLFNHVKLHSNTGKGWICDQCGQQFPRKDYFERHKCARPPTKIKT